MRVRLIMFAKEIRVILFFACFCACFTACTQPPEPQTPDYVLKTSLIRISSEEFSEELDLKQSAYPYTIKEQPDAYNEMVIHLVKVLSEELVLMSEAKEKGVQVSDSEVDQAEIEFKKDYPEDSFDQMLLKNAISYAFWKKRFKKHMIMDRLIEQELQQKIEISSADLIDFYEKFKNQTKDPSNDGEDPAINFQDEEQLVARLRLQKTQDSYDEWIQALWSKFPIEIDKEKLKTFLIDIDASKGN